MDKYMREIIKHDNKMRMADWAEDKMVNNYVEFSDFSVLYKHYSYVDVTDYLADELFEKHKIHIRYENEMYHPDHGYRIIMCKIPRWEERKFLIAMDELKDKMLICGHGDYIKFCKYITQEMIKPTVPGATG